MAAIHLFNIIHTYLTAPTGSGAHGVSEPRIVARTKDVLTVVTFVLIRICLITAILSPGLLIVAGIVYL